jgi:hypothetical protein
MKSPAAKMAAKLRRRGFDKTKVWPGDDYATIGCSQCNAVAIQGLACHELGCPNERRK